MAKVITSAQYNEAFAEFVARLGGSQPKKIYRVETGRKFDKVFAGDNVRFFVQRTTGAIYGAKSELAPNMKWWYGDIYTAGQWTWSGDCKSDGEPVPLGQAKVRIVGQYGSHTHYEPEPLEEKKNA